MTPRYKRADLWGASDPIIAVTTNAAITGQGELVMGKGAAREAALRWPVVPLRAANYISNTYGNLGRYGFFTVPVGNRQRCGLFQVKEHWRDHADLGLIAFSVEALRQWLQQNKGMTVALNFPGIGNGRQTVGSVLPVLDPLPDAVTIYYQEPENDEWITRELESRRKKSLDEMTELSQKLKLGY